MRNCCSMEHAFGNAELVQFLHLKFFFNVYSFLIHRVRAGEGQRERETSNLKQAPGCQCRAQSGARTHKL